MERAIEGTGVSQAPADDLAASGPRGAPADRAPARRRARQFDDVPSAVRALLTGYDEA